MQIETLLKIQKRVEQISQSEGVCARVDTRPYIHEDNPMRDRCWDIKLTYNGYNLVERFNSRMRIENSDVDRISIMLLKVLFTDYFEAKAEQIKRGN